MADDSIGALWVKEKMMSGNIEVDGKKIDIVVFKNTYKKEGERTPDYRIFKSKPKGETRQTSNQPDDDPEIEAF